MKKLFLTFKNKYKQTFEKIMLHELLHVQLTGTLKPLEQVSKNFFSKYKRFLIDSES